MALIRQVILRAEISNISNYFENLKSSFSVVCVVVFEQGKMKPGEVV